MDATEVNGVVKVAIGTLKESISVGKEGGALVSDVQADSHAIILQQQRIRERERHRQEHLGSQQEQKSYTRFISKMEELKVSEDLKAKILKEHGVAGWDAYLKAKGEVEAQDKAESEHVSDDELHMADVTWWCFAVAMLLSYLITHG
tara:strand:+ start:29 stop:469 length:441 start_codon:yes stop_codon:yes gene_type:complete